MNRKITVTFLILVLCFSLSVSVCAAADTDFVYDDADLLSDVEEEVLTQKLKDISAAYNAQIVVVATDSVEGGDINESVEYIYDSMGIGYGEDCDGVMLLVCMDLREYRILSNGFASEAVDTDDIDRIGDVIVSDLSAGDYAAAFFKFADECAYYLDIHINGVPFDFGKSLRTCLIIGIVIALIVVFILKGQLKSVRRQNQANVYVKPGSMQVTLHNDIFLYRNVTRTKKESNNSSGSRSGSSRSIGGGKF